MREIITFEQKESERKWMYIMFVSIIILFFGYISFHHFFVSFDFFATYHWHVDVLYPVVNIVGTLIAAVPSCSSWHSAKDRNLSLIFSIVSVLLLIPWIFIVLSFGAEKPSSLALLFGGVWIVGAIPCFLIGYFDSKSELESLSDPEKDRNI